MQDELFMRQWNQGHEDFTADLHSTLKQLGRYRRTRDADPVIGSPYDRILDRRPVEVTQPSLSPAASASLRGLAASVITLVLWVAVMLVATPAPGLAATPEAPATVATACLAHPVLA
jgi:hypothetical protein